MTLDNVAAKPMLAGCGTKDWEVGLQQEVGGTACLGSKALAECGVDYDIAAIRGGVLYPGARTPDMCKPPGRPTALQSTGAKHQG